MTDPIACPECQGRKGQRFGADLFLTCQFCGGLGWVGGHNEPAERGDEQESPVPPAAWEHRVWRDPVVAAALPCRYCLGNKKVASVNEASRTMTMAACPACSA
ncbi:hypothetical protein [Streptosporangium jomthongense]|uniref:Transcription factor zinc-finger domain-containing protein n=1 Tax=Streptosporangium jomthongense TaxID=1193683 RepID=A0ABV8F7E4_9ACTN